MGARLVIDKGPLSGTELVLEEGLVWSLGRDADKNDIALEDEKLAPSQLKIALVDGQYTITNLDQEYPVFLDGEQLQGTKTLTDGERLTFGSCQYVFYKQAYASQDVIYEFSLGPDAKADASLFPMSGSKEATAVSQGPVQSLDLAEQKSQTTENHAAASTGKLTDKDQELAQSFLNHVHQDSSSAQEAHVETMHDQTPQPDVSKQAKENSSQHEPLHDTATKETTPIMEDNEEKSRQNPSFPASEPAEQDPIQASSSHQKQESVVASPASKTPEHATEVKAPIEKSEEPSGDSKDQSSSAQQESEKEDQEESSEKVEASKAENPEEQSEQPTVEKPAEAESKEPAVETAKEKQEEGETPKEDASEEKSAEQAAGQGSPAQGKEEKNQESKPVGETTEEGQAEKKQEEGETPKEDASEEKSAEQAASQDSPEQGKEEKSQESKSVEETTEEGQAEETSSEESAEEKEGSEDKQSEEEGNEEKTDEEKEGSEGSENEGTDENEQNKKEALTPFDVQDLFRFDQGIFPVDVDDAAHKHIEADLSQPSRFLLKVLAGANIGAEFHLDSGKTYILGSDADTADIVFNDASVSHQHAKIIIGNDNSMMLEDLGSKNGVIIEGRKIEHNSTLSANQVVALGTTLFLLVDHAAPANTIIATFAPEDYGLFGRPHDEEALAKQAIEEEEAKRKQATLPAGSFILTLFIGGLAVLFGIGTASLFNAKEVTPIETVDAEADLDRIIQEFPSVRYTFNRGNGQLFLIGHVKNSIDKSELLYKVDSLPFIRAVDDNVINDEAVWQEMNILLSKRPEFKGVSMHSPEPGKFVISGYLKTENQAACLSEYLNLHFNYLSLLENKVIVETYLFKTVTGQLLQAGFANIQVSFANGEMILTGYINQENSEKFQSVLESLSQIPGIRMIKNFVVVLPVEEGIIDLNLRYPRRYRVTGYSKYGDVSINVVINGRILTRGDVLDGMTITSIQPNCIFLEKDGLKYKIEYNK